METYDHSLLESAELRALLRRKTRVNLLFSLLMLIVYSVYFIAIAWFPEWMGSTPFASSSISMGIWFTVASVIFSVILSGVYIWWANAYFDEAMQALLEKRGSHEYE